MLESSSQLHRAPWPQPLVSASGPCPAGTGHMVHVSSAGPRHDVPPVWRRAVAFPGQTTVGFSACREGAVSCPLTVTVNSAVALLWPRRSRVHWPGHGLPLGQTFGVRLQGNGAPCLSWVHAGTTFSLATSLPGCLFSGSHITSGTTGCQVLRDRTSSGERLHFPGVAVMSTMAAGGCPPLPLVSAPAAAPCGCRAVMGRPGG